MGKSKLKIILTFAYGAVVSALFYYMLYLVSFQIRMNFKESLFMIALVLVLIGIVVLISRTPRNSDKTYSRQKQNDADDDNIGDDDRCDYYKKPWPWKLLLGVNGLSLVLSGIYLLIIDSILK